jgi:L-seryl-tRNA(Ser) seleniumtransferase
MKVAPEEYLGMMVALETSLKFDEEAEFQRQLKTVNGMGAVLSRLPGLKVETHIPHAEAREPYIEILWDESQYKTSVDRVKQALRNGSPSIEIRALFLSAGNLHLTAVLLKEGEADIVVQRVTEVLQESI